MDQETNEEEAHRVGRRSGAELQSSEDGLGVWVNEKPQLRVTWVTCQHLSTQISRKQRVRKVSRAVIAEQAMGYHVSPLAMASMDRVLKFCHSFW